MAGLVVAVQLGVDAKPGVALALQQEEIGLADRVYAAVVEIEQVLAAELVEEIVLHGGVHQPAHTVGQLVQRAFVAVGGEAENGLAAAGDGVVRQVDAERAHQVVTAEEAAVIAQQVIGGGAVVLSAAQGAVQAGHRNDGGGEKQRQQNVYDGIGMGIGGGGQRRAGEGRGDMAEVHYIILTSSEREMETARAGDSPYNFTNIVYHFGAAVCNSCQGLFAHILRIFARVLHTGGG